MSSSIVCQSYRMLLDKNDYGGDGPFAKSNI